MRDLTFEALRTVGFVERHGVRWPIIHPDDRYRQLGRALIRDAFQLHPDDFVADPWERPYPKAAPQG